jgi:DNA-directed RNA polymerase specialized sigma24 family protein
VSTADAEPNTFGADSDSGQRRDHEQTLRALRALDLTERKALCLIYWQSRSHVQVAADLQIPVDAVRIAVARGMRELAASITDH